ncbi:glutamine amidotransferase of anthranilate synthase [Desulfofarcimen acetoxidans DSM 771]|jgi:anthranilate synthase/aminodeoxychorismate synthase-like glutamine amidotransferase|uniref:Glutamine amidotransferase of anthranilate synthase n=1 Tax=Desulfofarcimen acetoxidans (strain ATCC 49208 / DSM 771 / KCTC 5769 / VKM B-1644 / 5575) TaxID=485916 RepID=C8VZB0_DESAS|nr:aminodeoxychorismate/anthranilate synthase component II [Desulfofarcimen acetoxidans]ACV64855.1 glutamine amidotransferase of anthranilate synthase [Desulfofarcimen acetoxidans DSM 771]
MLVLIDNYDSFVYNLYQYLCELGQEVLVFRNDKVTLAQIEALSPSHIIISPGPCSPNEAGISMEVISYFAGRIPVLGVCLGHQSIGQVFGGRVLRSPRMMHGKTSRIRHDGRTVYKDLPNPMTTARYHSLIVEKSDLPPVLEITSETSEGELMGVRHKEYTVEGVQFHPESILTTAGKELLANFLELKGGLWRENPAFA